MGFKCLPQIMGLTRQSAAAAMKKDNRGGLKEIIEEFLETRYSKSEVLDRARSKLNEYFRYNDFNANMSASEIVSEIEFEVARHRTKVKTKNGTAERAIRKDAVVGWAVIINPPDEIKKDWTPEQNEQFYKDSMEYMAQLNEMFRSDNYICGAVHWDEGDPDLIAEGYNLSHYHCAGYAKDENGEFTCGNEIDFMMKDRINREYAAFMRSRGWDVDDPETRYTREDKTPKKSMTANEYRHFKRAEKFEKQVKDLKYEVGGLKYIKSENEKTLFERGMENKELTKELESLRNDKAAAEEEAYKRGKADGKKDEYDRLNPYFKELKDKKNKEIKQLKADLEAEKNKPAEIKTVEKPVEVVEYKDNPEQAEKITQLEAQVKQLQEDLQNSKKNSLTPEELEGFKAIKEYINNSDDLPPSMRSYRGLLEHHKILIAHNKELINSSLTADTEKEENEKLKKKQFEKQLFADMGVNDIQKNNDFQNDGL